MTIRLAYDISLLGLYFDRADSKTGVARTFEELLLQLSNRDDVELTAMALCGQELNETDPVQNSIQSYLYFKAHHERIRGSFAPTFKSRLGLTRLYQEVFSACYAEDLRGATSDNLRSILRRRARGILYRLHYTYGIDQLGWAFDCKRYDVYHSSFFGLPPESLTRGVARVLTIYDLIPISARDFVAPHVTLYTQRLFKTINIESDWVTCISEHTKNEFCEYTGMSPDRVFVTPLAASAAFRPIEDVGEIAVIRQRYGIPDGNYFLSLAAPQPRKNLAHLIRCFFRLLEEQPGLDLRLVLAGSKSQGWMYDEVFEAAAAAPKYRDRVAFTGFVADEDLAALYSGALGFIFPSLYEGFGLPPLEAMACGTPVISSDATALPEVVGGAGLMVKPTDEDALCEAMLNVLNDSRLRQELSQKGLVRAAQFSWQRCAAETVNVYRTAVSG